MKIILALVLVLVSTVPLLASEIIKVPLSDGETMVGKLEMPASAAKVREIVIYVHGTGPSTYDKRRKSGSKDFNYFDLFAEGFTRRGAAFFTYSKRGVEDGDTPPMYEKVDREKYKKVLPSVEVKDIGALIAYLRRDKRLKNARFVLLGWSEGSIIASLAADDPKNRVGALFLAGYANENLFDVIKWQNTGGSSMVNIRPFFDTDKNNSIIRAEYESDAKPTASFRARAFGGAKFEQLDVNKDEAIDIEDFRLLNMDRYKAILDAAERGDDDWIWNNYFHVTTAWLKEHFALEANKTRLLRHKVPIYIFQGENDANCPVEGVYDLRARFDKAGKKNLHEFVFKGHNHDLNYQDWIAKGEISEGIKKIFETAETLKK
jgi:pimeloyl-ACP methyl ester carboxylesterase